MTAPIEERRPRLVPVEDVEQLGRVRWIGAVVERERDMPRIARTTATATASYCSSGNVTA
jgi:hypothetical protein